jgi:PAS domain S-box-containing protein
MTEKPNLKQVSAELAEIRMRYQSLLDNCVDGIVVIDGAGNIKEFSQAAEVIFRYSAADVRDKNVSMLMPEPDRGQHDGYMRHYIEGGEARIIGIGREVTGRRKDGSLFPMDLSVGEMTEGDNRRFVGVIRDISSRREMEQQLRQASKMEALGQLTGGIAHDFNNILAILMLDLEMLSDLAEKDEEAAELIGEALDVTRNGADLTHRLLAFSRRQALSPSVIDVATLVMSTARLLQRTIGVAIRIDTVCDADLWPILADRGQLENALLNLAVNARDAMPDGGTLSIEAVNHSQTQGGAGLSSYDAPTPGDYVHIKVCDTGTGMPDDVKEHVFEPFFTTKEGGHGTGLGLSMVYGFIKQSGGYVEIDSMPGWGTTLHLYIPRGEAEPRVADDTVKPGLPVGQGRILLVEDHAGLRQRTSASLTDCGYTVAVAVNGDEAQRRLDAGETYDLVLTDIVMPGEIGGIALAKNVLASGPQPSVMLMTGYADSADGLADLLEQGIKVLNKPFSRSELSEAIQRVLSG